MDARVSASFYHVSAKPTTKANFPDLLLAAADKATIGDRERSLDGGVTLRLERCKKDGEFVRGEFCRKQTTNIPPGAGPDGLAPLNLGKGRGLGHTSAFRYHIPTKVLLLQRNMQGASPTRLASYLAAGNSEAIFGLKPIFRKDALERLKNKDVRSLEVGFASPTNLAALDEDGVAAATGAKLLTEAYNGIAVTIIVSVGRRRNKFLDYTKVLGAITKLVASNADVKTVKVTTSLEDDEAPINFLHEHLKVSEDLYFQNDDPYSNYEVRKRFLKKVFSDNMAYLVKLYGPNADGNAG